MMAKQRQRVIEGSMAEVRAPVKSYDEDKSYEVRLARPVEWPKGSRHFLIPEKKITITGKVAKAIEANIIEAYEAK
jgi:hypothetical protein